MVTTAARGVKLMTRPSFLWASPGSGAPSGDGVRASTAHVRHRCCRVAPASVFPLCAVGDARGPDELTQSRNHLTHKGKITNTKMVPPLPRGEGENLTPPPLPPSLRCRRPVPAVGIS